MPRHEPDLLDRIVENFSLRGMLLHQATLFLLATGTVIVGAIVLWGQNKDKIVDQTEFRLTEERIQLTPQPEWIATDLRQVLLNEVGEEPSILDSTLVPNSAGVMKAVGYIERVNRIEKSRSGLNIDVSYRLPVAVVELSEVTIPEWPKENRGKSVLLPVDRNGIVMPEDLVDYVQVPLISVLYPADFNSLKTWSDWPDERVKDAASIGKLFVDAQNTYGINRIVTFRKPSAPDDGTLPFELWSESGAQIIWGSAPGKEAEGEASAAEKHRAIQALISEHGAIGELNQIRIDIRSGQPVVAGDMKTAANELLFSRIK